jgi:hypothetical protein
MKHHSKAQVPAAPAGAWARFWFTPADPFGLNVLRVATGALLIAWLLTLTADAQGLFGLNGWFDAQAFRDASRQAADVPKPASWSLLYLCGESSAAFHAVFWTSLAVLGLFTLGLFPRVTAPLAWVVVSSFTASPAFDEEVEALFRLLSLYLAVGYLLQGPWRNASWFERLFGPWRTFLFSRARGEAPGSIGVNVALRLMQVHLALVIVVSGLHKLQSGYWWAGVAHWYVLYPPLETNPDDLRVLANSGRFYLTLLNLAGYATLAWQLAFPAFAWRSGWWRALLIGGSAVGSFGLAVAYRMPAFAAAFVIGSFAYLNATEWQLVRSWLKRIVAQAPAAPSAERPAPQEAVAAGGR